EPKRLETEIGRQGGDPAEITGRLYAQPFPGLFVSLPLARPVDRQERDFPRLLGRPPLALQLREALLPGAAHASSWRPASSASSACRRCSRSIVSRARRLASIMPT